MQNQIGDRILQDLMNHKGPKKAIQHVTQPNRTKDDNTGIYSSTMLHRALQDHTIPHRIIED